MKKSVCLMAILGAFAIGANAATQQSIDIKFTGQVIEQNCQVSLANGQDELNLGSIMKSSADGEKGIVVPVLLKLTNCGDALTAVNKFELLSDLSVNHWGNTNITNGTLSTNQSGVVVQFYEDASGKVEAAPKLVAGSIAEKKGTVLGGYAALKRIGSDELQAGDVKAKGMFALTYN